MNETGNGINSADTVAMVREECLKRKDCPGCKYAPRKGEACTFGLSLPMNWVFEGEEDDSDD